MSTAWEELGGIPSSTEPPKLTATTEPSAPAPPAHVHQFDLTSGWCACGIRDDGKTDS